MTLQLEKWKAQKKALKLTFDDLADKTNISRRQLQYLFNGEIDNPRIETVQAIERALGFTDSWTEEEKALGVGNHPIVLTEREHDWVITLNEAEEVLGEQYVATVIQMVKLNIQQKGKS